MPETYFLILWLTSCGPSLCPVTIPHAYASKEACDTAAKRAFALQSKRHDNATFAEDKLVVFKYICFQAQ